jgi:hypothetical protein
MATHFSRLLRHAWVTVGLLLFPGHHMGKEAYENIHIPNNGQGEARRTKYKSLKLGGSQT